MPIPQQNPPNPPGTQAEQLQAPGAATLPPFQVLLLQAQVLQGQLDGLMAQRIELLRQLRTLGTTGDPAIPSAQLAEVNSRIASVTGDLANVRSQIAQRQGRPTSSIGYPPGAGSRNNGLNGGQVTAVFIVFLLAVAMPMSLGITRWLFRRSARPAPPPLDAVSPRFERLEQAVDSIAIEIERISEGQRFVTKVLAERPVGARPASSPESDASNLGGGEAFRALGAGPMEQIRIPERQVVRPSITPH